MAPIAGKQPSSNMNSPRKGAGLSVIKRNASMLAGFSNVIGKPRFSLSRGRAFLARKYPAVFIEIKAFVRLRRTSSSNRKDIASSSLSYSREMLELDQDATPSLVKANGSSITSAKVRLQMVVLKTEAKIKARVFMVQSPCIQFRMNYHPLLQDVRKNQLSVTSCQWLVVGSPCMCPAVLLRCRTSIVYREPSCACNRKTITDALVPGLRITIPAYPQMVPQQPHLQSIIYHLSSVICHLSSIICYLSSVICYLLSVICYLSSIICHLSSVIYHLLSIICYLLSIICYLLSCKHVSCAPRRSR